MQVPIGVVTIVQIEHSKENVSAHEAIRARGADTSIHGRVNYPNTRLERSF